MAKESKYFMKRFNIGGERFRVRYIMNHKRYFTHVDFIADAEGLEKTDWMAYLLRKSTNPPTKIFVEEHLKEITEGYEEIKGIKIPKFLKEYHENCLWQNSKRANREGYITHKQVHLPLVNGEVDEGLFNLLSIFNDPENKYYAPTAYSCEGDFFGKVIGNNGYIMFTQRLEEDHPIMEAILNSGYGVKVIKNKDKEVFNNGLGKTKSKGTKPYKKCFPNEFLIEQTDDHMIYGKITTIRWGFDITIKDLEELFGK